MVGGKRGRSDERMTFVVVVSSLGLCAGIQAMRMAWDPRLRSIASIAVAVCLFVLIQTLVALLAARLV
jgi:hypothetical protein